MNSDDTQREESIEGQLRECQAFAEKNDNTIPNTCIDRVFSSKADNRLEFQHMISDSKKALFRKSLFFMQYSQDSASFFGLPKRK